MGSSGEKKRILIIEDDESISLGLRMMRIFFFSAPEPMTILNETAARG